MSTVYFEEKVLGGPEDFIEVRHLVVRGDNFEIGRHLVETAQRNHAAQKGPAADPRKVRAQRSYIHRNYPIHYERMQGAAAALGLDLENDAYDFSYLNYAPWLPGCSTVYYPPASTQQNHAILSRNFDFTTGTFMGTIPQPGEVPAAARPYIIHCYPDQGHPSLYLCSFDLLAGCLDGMNARGLVVALNADAESGRSYPMQPTFGGAVGISEIQLARLLLDTCANVEEAQQVLLTTKQFYMCAPCHYLIADRSGRSFVWEYSYAHNTEYLVEGSGRPQILTNHLLSRYSSVDELPVENFAASSYSRYRTLLSRVGDAGRRHSLEEIKAHNTAVFITDSSYPQPQPVPDRTIWHAMYDADALNLEISFYLQDQVQSGERIPVRSEYLCFDL